MRQFIVGFFAISALVAVSLYISERIQDMRDDQAVQAAFDKVRKRKYA